MFVCVNQSTISGASPLSTLFEAGSPCCLLCIASLPSLENSPVSTSDLTIVLLGITD